MTKRPAEGKRQSENKLFCKLCLDNGQPMSVVTSHYIVGKNGKSICPTKACLKCTKCGRLGHTIRYCLSKSHVSQETDKFLDKYCTTTSEVKYKPEPEPAAKTSAIVAAVASTNPFAQLQETSEEESPRTPRVLSKPLATPEADCPWAPTKAIKKKPVNWAEWSDSEDEE